MKKLGPLEPGECYSFFPALALGGPARPENLRRVPAREHVALLAQLGEIQLIDHAAWPEKIIRALGG